MATLIPSLGSARFDSRGELRLAERLKDFLEENAYIWHNLPMGPRGRHPDFVIVHPAKGLLVLEVKDWRMDTIASATKSDVELVTTSGSVRTISPFEQALGLHVRCDEYYPRRDPAPSAGSCLSGQVGRAFRIRRRVHQHHPQAIRADGRARSLSRRPLRVQR